MSKKVRDTQIVKIKKLIKNYELRYDYNPMLNTFLKTFPSSHRKTYHEFVKIDGTPKKKWVWSISEHYIGNVIDFLVDNSIELKFENLSERELNQLRYEYIQRQQQIENSLKIKFDNIDVSNDDYSFMKIIPYGYQKKAVRFFEVNEGIAILGDSPGVGKSCPSMAYPAKYKYKTLIICPANLKLNWRNEILKFTNEKVFVYKYNPTKSSGEINYSKEESLFHIINYESLRSYLELQYKHSCKNRISVDIGKRELKDCGWVSIDNKAKHKKCPNCGSTKVKSRIFDVKSKTDKDGNFIQANDYDLVILDECQRIKNPKTYWTELIKRSFRDIVKRKILISGTVVKNSPYEFFHILNFINPAEWKNSHEFGVRYGAGYEGDFGWDYSGASNLGELYQRISPFFLRRLKKDVLPELPPKTYTIIPIEMTSAQKKTYKKIQEEVIENLKEDSSGPTHLSIIHKLKKYLADIKADKAKEFIRDHISGGDKLVVFSFYVDTAKKVYEEFKDVSVLYTGEETNIQKKQGFIESFQNDKKIKLFSGTIGAASVGITLTAASELVFLDSAWTYSDMEQAEDRVHRASSTANKIHIIKFIVKESIDEDIEEILKRKEMITSKIMDGKFEQKEKTVIEENMMKELIKSLKKKS